jgi:hypothetical protein
LVLTFQIAKEFLAVVAGFTYSQSPLQKQITVRYQHLKKSGSLSTTATWLQFLPSHFSFFPGPIYADVTEPESEYVQEQQHS